MKHRTPASPPRERKSQDHHTHEKHAIIGWPVAEGLLDAGPGAHSSFPSSPRPCAHLHDEFQFDKEPGRKRQPARARQFTEGLKLATPKRHHQPLTAWIPIRVMASAVQSPIQKAISSTLPFCKPREVLHYQWTTRHPIDKEPPLALTNDTTWLLSIVKSVGRCRKFSKFRSYIGTNAFLQCGAHRFKESNYLEAAIPPSAAMLCWVASPGTAPGVLIIPPLCLSNLRVLPFVSCLRGPYRPFRSTRTHRRSVRYRLPVDRHRGAIWVCEILRSDLLRGERQSLMPAASESSAIARYSPSPSTWTLLVLFLKLAPEWTIVNGRNTVLPRGLIALPQPAHQGTYNVPRQCGSFHR